MSSPVETLVKAPRTFDTRAMVALGIGALGLGVILGFKLAAGAEPFVVREGIPVEVNRPCADCAERALKDARAASSRPAEDSTPGDSSIPDGD